MKMNEKGFTLLELVVVIAIIGIISAIAMMQYQHITAKAKAAQIASNLHVIEDGIVTAIIDGRTLDDFGSGLNTRIDASNFNSSVLKYYLSLSNFTQVPSGIKIWASATDQTGIKTFIVDSFVVVVHVDGEPGTDRILAELEKMFPQTLYHTVVPGLVDTSYVIIDASTLKVRNKPK